jgi:hypothetical protein
MKSSTWMVLGKRKSPLPQRPIPNTKTKTELETNTASGVHTGGHIIAGSGVQIKHLRFW